MDISCKILQIYFLKCTKPICFLENRPKNNPVVPRTNTTEMPIFTGIICTKTHLTFTHLVHHTSTSCVNHNYGSNCTYRRGAFYRIRKQGILEIKWIILHNLPAFSTISPTLWSRFISILQDYFNGFTILDLMWCKNVNCNREMCI